MRFLMIMIPDVYRKPVPSDFKPDLEAIRKMGEYNEQLRKVGVLLALDGLTPPSAGARVSFAGGKVNVTDEWAKRCPAAANDIIEIRRVYEPEDFG